MNYKFLLIPVFSLIMAVSCKDANKEVIEPTVPAETKATIEYNENRLDTVSKQTDENDTFRGGGTDPFWSVQFSKGKIHFKAPGASLKSFVAPIPEPEISGNSKKYIAQSHRVLMEVLITEEECIDTKSSKKSSHKVKVSIKPKSETDFNIFEGCGS